MAAGNSHEDRYRTLPSHDRSRLILSAAAGSSSGTINGRQIGDTHYESDFDNCIFLRTPSMRTLELLKEKRESIV